MEEKKLKELEQRSFENAAYVSKTPTEEAALTIQKIYAVTVTNISHPDAASIFSFILFVQTYNNISMVSYFEYVTEAGVLVGCVRVTRQVASSNPTRALSF